MTGTMTWEAPPPPASGTGSGAYNWPDIARQVRAKPGEWLRVFENGPISIVNAVRQGSMTAINPTRRLTDKHAGFEIRTRNNKAGPPKTADLYLRWWDPESEGGDDAPTDNG